MGKNEQLSACLIFTLASRERRRGQISCMSKKAKLSLKSGILALVVFAIRPVEKSAGFLFLKRQFLWCVSLVIDITILFKET